MLSLQEELWQVFSLRQKTFSLGSQLTEEAIKTSAITIIRATKFVAILRTLNFNTKIHTCGQNILFLGKICCRAGSKETFFKMATSSVEAIWILKMPPYSCYRVSMETLSFPFLFTRKFSCASQAFVVILPLCPSAPHI